jgi:hypothetical protein
LLLRLEQPDVLDRDHRLVGEDLNQLYLRFSERPYGSLMQDEEANWNPLSQKWHAEDSAIAAESCCFKESVFGISENIRYLNRFALQQNSPDSIRNWVAQADRDEGRREDGLTGEELNRLRRENRQLKLEREILSNPEHGSYAAYTSKGGTIDIWAWLRETCALARDLLMRQRTRVINAMRAHLDESRHCGCARA